MRKQPPVSAPATVLFRTTINFSYSSLSWRASPFSTKLSRGGYSEASIYGANVRAPRQTRITIHSPPSIQAGGRYGAVNALSSYRHGPDGRRSETSNTRYETGMSCATRTWFGHPVRDKSCFNRTSRRK